MAAEAKKAAKAAKAAAALLEEEAANAPLAPIAFFHVDAEPEQRVGDYETTMSHGESGRDFKLAADLGRDGGVPTGESVWLRARVANVRSKGSSAFLVLRQGAFTTVQACLFKDKENPDESKRMLKVRARRAAVALRVPQRYLSLLTHAHDARGSGSRSYLSRVSSTSRARLSRRASSRARNRTSSCSSSGAIASRALRTCSRSYSKTRRDPRKKSMPRRTPSGRSRASARNSASTTVGWTCAFPRTTPSCASSRACALSSARYAPHPRALRPLGAREAERARRAGTARARLCRDPLAQTDPGRV